MKGELISEKTRQAFREYLVENSVLREIGDEFHAAGIGCDGNYEPQVSGQRRIYIEQHYHTVNFSKAVDVRKLLTVYESILNTAERRVAQPTPYSPEMAKNKLDKLAMCLRNDGYKYEKGKIFPITPSTKKAFEATLTNLSITNITRREIFDLIQIQPISWSGRLTDSEFLSRLYDLDALPSYDSRFKTASGDIWQHTENNFDDWSRDWVFSDGRFNLSQCPDADFLAFLCEMVHPFVRPDTAEALEIVAILNEHLAVDGWEIVEAKRISDKPVFTARSVIEGITPSLKTAKVVVQAMDAEYLHRQIVRMESAVNDDPELAIGTAKELVETCCKTILTERGKPVTGTPDIPTLTKQTFKELKLVPEGIPDEKKGAETIKRMLSNLATIAQGLAELRSIYGTGHGKHGKTQAIKPRHAKLAVGAAATLATFLFETHKVNSNPSPK